MKRNFTDCKEAIKNNAARVGMAALAVGTALATSGVALAEGEDAVAAQFQTITTGVTSTLTTIAPLAGGILLIFIGWKFGKRIFNTITGR